jgi:hypothetical protein
LCALVPLTARTPRDVFHTLQDHLNRTLNRVLTHYRLRFFIRTVKGEQVSLAFFNNRGVTIAVPLLPSPWYLSLSQRLQAVPEGKEYTLRILEYQYRVQRTPSVEDEAEVRFEYVSRLVDPDFPYSCHHVQLHRDYHEVRQGFSPQKLHIPTGGVTVEDVIRFLVTDLGVPPLIETWDEELRKSEKQFREWTQWDDLE